MFRKNRKKTNNNKTDQCITELNKLSLVNRKPLASLGAIVSVFINSIYV